MKVFILMTLVAMVTIGRAEFDCGDGEVLPDRDRCDDYCDCQMCDDEVDCEGGLGVSKFGIGDLKMRLNFQQAGGQTAVLTKDVPYKIGYWTRKAGKWIWWCIFRGDCSGDWY